MTLQRDEGIACKLSPADLAARRQQLLPGLFGRAEQVTDIPDGVRLRFASAPGCWPTWPG